MLLLWAVAPGVGMPRKDGRPQKKEAAVKQEAVIPSAIVCIDLDDEDVRAAVKSEIKREIKAEPKEGRRKKTKVKKERPDDRDRSRSRHRDKERKHEERDRDGRRRRSRSRSRSRRRRSASRGRSSSSSSSSSSSESAMYRRLKPYTKVQLVNLVRKADLNGMSGQVLHPSCAVSPCPPGCMLVRLETGREIAVKPQNLIPLQSFHVGPHQAPLSQEARLNQVLKSIKLNIDNVMDRTNELRNDIAIMDGGSRGVPQGGIGHQL